MKTTKRTDPHRPGAIVPSEYRYRFSYALASMSGGWPVPSWNIDLLLALRKSEKFSAFGGTGKCSICGAVFIDGDVWTHEPTGENIHVGHTCADKYEMLADRTDFELAKMRAREGAAIEAKRALNAEARAAFLTGRPGLDAAIEVDHPIIRDIKAKFVQYLSISDKQIALVLKLANEVANPPAAEAHVDAPIGRQTFRGEVVSIKSDEYWGGQKITVKVTTPNGSWLAWGSCPAGCYDNGERTERGLVGCEVEITATLKPGRDKYFALMSRPKGVTLGLGEKAKAAKAAKEIEDAARAEQVVADAKRMIAEYEAEVAARVTVRSADVTELPGSVGGRFVAFASDIGLTCEKLANGWPSLLYTEMGNGQPFVLNTRPEIVPPIYRQDYGCISLIVHND